MHLLPKLNERWKQKHINIEYTDSMKNNLFLCVITLLALMVESHKHTNEYYLLPPYFPVATNEYQTPVQRYILSLKKIKTINQKRKKKKEGNSQRRNELYTQTIQYPVRVVKVMRMQQKLQWTPTNSWKLEKPRWEVEEGFRELE